MRRLWAYIIVVFTALVAVFASFPAIIKDTTTNGEYETRREFTFQLVEREQTDDDEEKKELTDSSAKEIAEVMESRLVKSKITSYDISTSGNDMITVSFSADSESAYQQTVTYLTFSGSFALVNVNDDIVEGKDFLRGKAYTKSYAVNEYPTVIIPVKTDSTDYETLIQGAKDNPVTPESSSEDEEADSVARLYLLYNWVKGETYQTLSDAGKLDSKTLLQIDFTPDDKEEGLYYDSNKNSFSRICGFQDTNGNGTADPKEVTAAYQQADYLVNLFSASAYDYEVKCIKGLQSGTEVWLEAKTEEFLDNGKLVWNRTMTAVLAAIVMVSILLVFFYKLGALSAASTTLVSVFFAILVMVKTGLEYNVFAVAGIVTVALLSLISGIIYLNKIKDDAYKGHTLKKANTEASKKSLLPIIDIHVAAIAVGVMCYVLGGTALRSFAAILGIGAVISALINTLGLKGIMWLCTNATALNGRYDLFGINKENVPDHMAEEKQTFYGTYTGKNFTKHKKSIGIISAIGFTFAVAGMVAAGVVRGGVLFKKPTSQHLGSEIYVQNTILQKDDNVSPLDDNSLQTILDSILIQKTTGVAIDQEEVIPEGEKPTTYITLSDYVTDKILFSTSETKVEEGGIAKTYIDTYYKLSLNTALKGTETAEIKGDPVPDQTLNMVLDDYFESTSTFTGTESSIELKQIHTVVTEVNPKWDKILIATSVAIGIITLYLLLRYRLSRGLASIVFPALSSAITLGLMLLLNFVIALPANVYICVPIITLFSYFFMISFFNKERELISEDKVKDNSVEHREEIASKALGIAYTPILVTAVIGIYLMINFFGFGTANMSNAYAACFVGAIIALGLISALLVPLCNWLFKLFSKVKIERKPRKSKKGNKPVRKSAEPEEAIFIGIND